MVIDMNESKLETIEHIREFLTGTAAATFSIPAEESTLRAFVATVIRRFRDFCRSKGQRGVLFASLRRLTGYSRQHLSGMWRVFEMLYNIQNRKQVNLLPAFIACFLLM
jgi:hypothetical protein